MTVTGTRSAGAHASLQWLVGDQVAVERLPMLRQALERVGTTGFEDLHGASSTPPRLTMRGIETAVAEVALAFEEGDHAVAVLNASDWGARLLVCADRQAVFAIVEMLMGGDGAEPSYAPERSLSRLEIDLAGVFFASFGRELAQSFAAIAPTSFSLEPSTGQVDLDMFGRQQAVAIARYRLEMLGRGGEVLLAIPQPALAALRKPLSQPVQKDLTRPDPGWAERIQQELARTHVTLSAVLEEGTGLLAEVLDFRVGQVIELKATPQTPVRVECNGERLMWCDLGKCNGVYTLRVDAFVDSEREFMNDILMA